jgi:hypothetical protein
MIRKTVYICVLGIILFLLSAPSGARAAGSLPEGLKNAAREFIAGLQVVDYGTRDSRIDNPTGIIPMATFDRETHSCHEAPGQSYRIFKDHIGFRKGPDGLYIGKVGYNVFYRQADTIAEVYQQEWKEGSDGILELTLQKLGGKWTVIQDREVIK